MTQRIFYEDSYIKEFTAAVEACIPNGENFLVCLDRTAFYPEGGGQPGDTGVLETDHVIPVLDTVEEAGQIRHVTREAIPVGTPVTGRIDWDRRFSLMQNHSGEHIVSGLIHAAFGYENVGFHMGSDFLTIDLSGELTMADLADIQRRANEIVWKDEKTDIRTYPAGSEIPFDYRSKKELKGDVRIVTFPGADVCACCGTHVSSTGQIGLIKLISCVKFKGGVRIEMLCGRNAMDYLERIWEQNHRISNLLSARPLQTSNAVERVMENERTARYELVRLEKIRIEQFARGLSGAGHVLVLCGPMSDLQGVRKLANDIAEQNGGICAVFSGNDETDYKYAIAHKGGDLRALVKKLNGCLSGRGGGQPQFAQGSVGAPEEGIIGFFEGSGLSGEEKKELLPGAFTLHRFE